jgi:hypothetical protein
VAGAVTTLVGILVTNVVEDGPGPEPLGPTTVAHDGRLEPVVGIRILKRDTTDKAYVLDDGAARSIPDGGTYVCTAKYYPVEFDVSGAVWAKRQNRRGDDAPCPTGKEATMDPDLITDHYLLLEHSSRPDRRRAAWLIVDGRRRRIPHQGALFDCLTSRYLVWDYVAMKDIRNFSSVSSKRDVRCR